MARMNKRDTGKNMDNDDQLIPANQLSDTSKDGSIDQVVQGITAAKNCLITAPPSGWKTKQPSPKRRTNKKECYRLVTNP